MLGWASCRPSQPNYSSKRTLKPSRPDRLRISNLPGMGKTNRKAPLESKIEHLLGEYQLCKEEVEKTEKLVEQLPSLRERLWEIQTLISP